ncbi:hypothetical protein C7M84_015842 [Penaeus vannamei]|uniref:BAH domain-containing protein n=1 Tax=Penaeus vannamei TaxID=6689 RepID=A0A423SPK9_PENVA|nr:hypothetical protein C7M84_015842 [Penaeus vannamei]
MNQGGSTGHQYQYRPAQHQNHPPHTGVSQDCPAAPVYHAGPLTTIMSSVNQPTIQVYGAVVPQPPVTLMSSQNPHATTPHPSAPPPVPAPVPPVVPLSQPQPAATTTIVAMAPITVTVPINPGTHSSPQSVGSPTSQSGGASAQAVSGSTHSSVALPPLSTAFVSGMSQPGIAPTQVTSVLSDMSQPMVTPAQVTTPMVSGIPQHSVTLTQVSSSISTGMSQTPIASPLATPFVSGMSQPTIAPTKVTAAVISGIPQTAIAPSSVTVSAVPTSSQLGGTQTSVATAKLTEKSQVTVIPAQVTTGSERNNESDTSSVDSEAAGGGRRRSKSKEESPKSNSASPFPSAFPPQPVNSGSRRRSATGHGKSKSTKKPRWVHNWSWEGEPFEGKIWLRNDELPLVRTCYSAMRHKEGDIVRVRDCVLLRSGPKKTDLPFVAKIAALWEDPETSDMMMSILWYYRPEHTESGRREEDLPDEIFASKHRDHLSVACIEDRCYVLTFNEYCRSRRRIFSQGSTAPRVCGWGTAFLLSQSL